MTFDVEGARRAGYSEAEIVDHLARERRFDAARARQSGYSDAEILTHLRAPIEPPRERMGALSAAGRGAIQGATFGFGDEIRGAIAGAGAALTGGSFGDAYAARRDEARELDRRAASDAPVANIAGSLGGAVGTALLTAPLSIPARAVQLARAIPGMARVALPSAMTGRVGSAVGGGAAGGALGGFGDGEGGLAARAGNAATGAVLGGAVGGVVAPVVMGGQAVARAISPTQRNLAGERLTLRALDRDGISLDDLRTRAAGMTPEQILPDLAGRNTVGLAATVANVPGEAMEVADRLVQARRAGRPERIEGMVAQSHGGGQRVDVGETVDALQARRASQAAPRYEAAFSRINPTADDVARVLPGIEDPIGQQALQRGLRVLEIENVAARLRDPSIEPFNPASLGVTRGENGEFVVQNGYRNLRLLDAIKRGYDEIVEGFRDPTSGRLNLDQYGRAVNDARAAYVGNLRDMYQRYEAALDAWAGPSASLEAVRQGRQSLRLDPDEVRRIAGRTAPANMDFMRLGQGRAITDMVSDPGRASGNARRLLEDGQMQARLAAVLDNEARDSLNEGLGREVRMSAVERAISPRAGSQTARLQAGQEDLVNDPAGPRVVGMLRALASNQGALSLGARGLENAIRVGQGITGSRADALARTLLAQGPQNALRTIQQLERRGALDAATADRMRVRMATILAGTTGGAAVAVPQSSSASSRAAQ